MEGLCQRYHCPPSVILGEDAGYLMRHLGILALEAGGGAGAGADERAGQSTLRELAAMSTALKSE